MTDGPGFPAALRRVLRWVLPGHRRDDVLGDLEESFRARVGRLGPRPARRLLWKEAASLVLWRLGAGLRAGGPTTHRPETRTGGDTMGRDLMRDLRFGLRTLARQPGFTFVAVAVLGLGIGAPTTVLTLVNRIFFQTPAEVSAPDRLFRAFRSWGPGQGGGSLSNPDFAYYRANASTLSGLAAYGGGGFVGAFSTGVDEPDQVRGLFVSDNYFDVLGVHPARGRFFLAEENSQPGTHAVTVLSDGFWRRALGADPQVVGRTVSVNGIPFTVVGIAPAAFQGISPVEAAPDAWFPIAMAGALTRATDAAWWERLADSRENWLTLVGRMAPGVTFEAAEANLTALSDALTYEGRGEEEGLMVLRDYLYSPRQAATLGVLSRLLLAVVALVLVIAAANVAVLLLSRATTRGREMGIRTAMGAGRGRLFRQLLAESLLLGVAGCAVGVGLAYAFSDAAATLLPLPFGGGFYPDLQVLGLAVGISLVAAVLVGLAPAFHAVRADVAHVIEGARTAVGRSRLRDALVVGQVALSLVLISGAVLFARSFQVARTQDLGFETANRLVLQVNLRAQGYTEDEGRAFLPRALERLAALPGVEGAALSRMIPFQGDWSTEVEPPPGARSNTEDGQLAIGLNTVSPGYFDLMGVPIVQGRPFGPQDTPGGGTAVILNEALADLLFPDGGAVGQTLPVGDGSSFEVVGVARNSVYYELGEEPPTQLYRSVFQAYQPRLHFVLKTRSDAASLAPAAQAALRELDPALTFPWVSTMASVFEDQTARYRVSAVLVGVFSVLALILAAAGLYGVVSFLVAQRTREIGVRMALGANRGRIAGEVLRTGLTLAAVGLGLGLVGTVAVRRLTTALLFGTVRADDPWPLLAGGAILAVVAAAASLVPARRATRVDPMEAIRAD